eukprot:2777891-Heterocapsa_arctica.AAC.1
MKLLPLPPSSFLLLSPFPFCSLPFSLLPPSPGHSANLHPLTNHDARITCVHKDETKQTSVGLLLVT